jgi:ParB-like chromosome segregation protein Spo0J
MARRRLTLGPLSGDTLDVPRAEHGSAVASPALSLNPTAPIARVAAEAAGAAALQELTEAVARARDEGRMVLDLPLDAIAPDHIARDRIGDRIAADGEDMAALRESIRLHGQRTPIEVTPLVPDGRAGALPYGLISGWRRLQALKALHAGTGEPRFSTVQALVRRPETAADAYVTMVEENEIRLGLSHYERARVAARATARGVFATEDEALRALFATASRPKRSRIRAFLEIVHALDDALRFPAHLPERLGLALVERLRSNPGERARIATALAAADPGTPEAELAALAAILASPKPAPTREALAPGLALETRLKGRTLTLKLTGEAVSPALAADLRTLLDRLPARRN